MDTPSSAGQLGVYAAHLGQRPRVRVFGVDYLHLRLDDGSDLYVTEYGLPFVSHLLPHNYWTDKDWFAAHSTKLAGTSTPYRITTKEIGGRSKDIVLKWNRMGEDIPGETQASDLNGAAFNSPFEEFALAIELRTMPARADAQFGVHKPLAVYVPRKYVEMDRLGRRRQKIQAIQKNHQEVTLDQNRQYAVIYEWMEGVDAAEACQQGLIEESTLRDLVSRTDRDMAQRGFRVRDNKPHHVIVRAAETGGLVNDETGRPRYGLVDFELLDRTPQHDEAIRGSRRRNYLVKQAHRFESTERFPPELTPVNIMGVDYVFGYAESTGGALWVVGRDPVLFEYFLPEKWRKTPRSNLSTLSRVYETVTKDSIHLVWRVSRVGERPDLDPFVGDESRILAHGYNSPFQEVAYSLELARKGVDTTYPRAIYRSGHKPEETPRPVDDSRYVSHAALRTHDGHPILGENHDYIMLWGYWNGPDELLARRDEDVYRGIDALRAHRQGLIAQEVYIRTVRAAAQRLREAGFEDLDLRGNHVLLSLGKSGQLVRAADGIPVMRLCNLELLRRLPHE